ncbi:MAG: dihydrouridine synthase [Candidatus Levybacteria bacterium CG_4_9_14_3_um_filter_35_16]|nr:MAG: dihydrouridine synthase [Candidatus Levybacteria bacterium CG22_combo_CG10-13_8_21_14_all_35_11]PIY95013.1 MAG: dihydrouridine synthase [Candidatus Levybacteria bacterium CG_4_10_14_0_8_um_filter_35_23]PJA91653.1 MAG: dihydrouridine synthase [Candidatus Levybacteria bacterium CG_4_9_14_3_um_filter_35_16]PJC54833.1 MAG: dihydrouridine synthase [Candidatus Levybacteria bacterium CG_4_9_14_0_2_um_filter_35_21]
MKNFWQKLQKPFTALAPMDGVTDYIFRQMIVSLGKPDVLFTEFTPVAGIFSKGKTNVIANLMFSKVEQPIVAQIWGSDPKLFYKTSKYISTLGFSGIDINMGCPDRVAIKTGGCSAIIKNQKLAGEIISATKKGAKNIPISIKTRIGFSENEVNTWIPFLLKQDIAALTVHLRTATELSKPAAHWEEMPKIIEMRNRISPKTIIIGNGDLFTLSDVRKVHDLYGCDGYMIGRGILANSWLFSDKININEKERFNTYLKHILLFKKTWGESKNFANLKKFCKVYINNFPDASKLREQIMETKNLGELENITKSLKDKTS